MVTAASNKLILRKKEFRNLGQAKEISSADPAAVHEIDLSFNALEYVTPSHPKANAAQCNSSDKAYTIISATLTRVYLSFVVRWRPWRNSQACAS